MANLEEEIDVESCQPSQNTPVEFASSVLASFGVTRTYSSEPWVESGSLTRSYSDDVAGQHEALFPIMACQLARVDATETPLGNDSPLRLHGKPVHFVAVVGRLLTLDSSGSILLVSIYNNDNRCPDGLVGSFRRSHWYSSRGDTS
eukprot:m.26738 g.26738  ORF g.26738 m.26738 type:complete len:146 (-) comp7827_c0_seq3:556-993(-)